MYLINYAYIGWDEHTDDSMEDAACPEGVLFLDKDKGLEFVKGAVIDEIAAMCEGQEEWDLSIERWVAREGGLVHTGYDKDDKRTAVIVIREIVPS